jgi:hypothetical protein
MTQVPRPSVLLIYWGHAYTGVSCMLGLVCLWQAAFSAHKAAGLRWCFSVLGLLAGYGVILERTFLLYPSDLYLYLYFVYLAY